MKRYNIKPEGLGEINIDLDQNGQWIMFEDYIQEIELIEITNILKKLRCICKKHKPRTEIKYLYHHICDKLDVLLSKLANGE